MSDTDNSKDGAKRCDVCNNGSRKYHKNIDGKAMDPCEPCRQLLEKTGKIEGAEVVV